MDFIRDKSGNVVPWFTFPALEFLAQLDLSDKSAFEFGSGGSTIYLDNNCKSVISVDDNPKFSEMGKYVSNKTQCKFVPGNYSKVILEAENNFDIIVIDGSYRLQCAEAAVQKLSKNGLLILDNSDWCRKTVKLLAEHLLEVDFHGNGHTNSYSWTTSFFFTRDFNFTYKNLRPGWSSAAWQRESFIGEENQTD